MHHVNSECEFRFTIGVMTMTTHTPRSVSDDPRRIPRPGAISQDDFKLAMSRLASGVSVVTAHHAGVDHGLTATAVCSLSAEPASIIVSTNLSSRTATAIHESGHLGISILGEHQQELALHFARSGDDKFTGLRTWRGEGGVPMLPGALVSLECQVHDSVVAWTHRVFFATIRAVRTAEAAPLAYYAGRFTGCADSSVPVRKRV